MSAASTNRIVLTVKDGAGVEHEILGDDFVAHVLEDTLSRLNALEALVVELVNRDAVVGKELREKAASFVKGRS